MDQMEDGKSYGYKDILKDHAWKFIILLGLVSLFADMTYEGARSITGPYLSILGASAVVVGFVSGLGELVGYGCSRIYNESCSGRNVIYPKEGSSLRSFQYYIWNFLVRW